MTIVTMKDNQPTTTSLIVAEVFGRSHNDVLKSTRALIQDMVGCISAITEGDFPPSNETNTSDYFIKTAYKDTTGRNLPMYIITEEGFALLAMGFTGKKALEFKISFLNEFKRLQEENQRLQLENTQLLEQRLDQSRQSYLELKGEMGSDLAEFYTNKLAQVETDNASLKHDVQSLKDRIATLKPSREDRHTLQAQAADATAKDMLKLLNAKAKQIRAHIKSITGWMKLNEHEYDYTLLNATEGIDAIVKHWAH